jgi:hypothetical protein
MGGFRSPNRKMIAGGFQDEEKEMILADLHDLSREGRNDGSGE